MRLPRTKKELYYWGFWIFLFPAIAHFSVLLMGWQFSYSGFQVPPAPEISTPFVAAFIVLSAYFAVKYKTVRPVK